MTVGSKQLDIGTASTLVLLQVNQQRTLLRTRHCRPGATSRGGLTTMSVRVRRIGLRFLRTLAEHPFVDIGWTMDKLNSRILASNQELNHPEIHQRNLAQVQDFAIAVAIH